MRMKIFHAIQKAARWVDRLLAVRLPIDAASGLRTRGR
jgi:hypothetical protein